MIYCMVIFIVGNLVIGGFTQSGAFEIYINDDLIHSKILTGKLPSYDAIFYAIDQIV